MALGNLFGRRRNKSAASPEATEVGLTLLLGDSQTGRTCSPEYVRDLRNRVARAAISELDQLLDPAWYRELVRLSPEEQEGHNIDPAWRRGFPDFSMGLEGPTMGVRLVIVRVPGWDLQAIAAQVYNVFDKHWKTQLDRDRPS